MIKEIILLSVILINLSANTFAEIPEIDAIRFIHKTNLELPFFYDSIRNITLWYHENFDALRRNIDSVAEISRDADLYQREIYTEKKELKIILNKLKRLPHLYVLGGGYYLKLNEKLKHLSSILEERKICNFRNQTNCFLRYEPDVLDIIKTSNDTEELKFYWDQVRSHNEDKRRVLLKEFVDSFQNASELIGISPRELWYHPYDDEIKFPIEMEKVIQQLKPFYTQIYSVVRYKLTQVYGHDIVPLYKPIQHHLFEQLMNQNWYEPSVLDEDFSSEVETLPNFTAALKRRAFTMPKLIEMVNEFYKSIDFDYPPESIWATANYFKSSDSKNLDLDQNAESYSNGNSTECKFEIYDETPNLLINYCDEVNFENFMKMHKLVGRIHYNLQKENLSSINYSSYNLEEAVAEASVLSIISHVHFKRIALLLNFEYNEKHSVHRLFRMAVPLIFNIFNDFVNAKVMSDLLSNQVELKYINQHYWNLMEEYCGIEAPIDRYEWSMDFSYNFYKNLKNNLHTKNFITKIASYQIYQNLCAVTELFYDSADLLHNCDFSDQIEAGDALKAMMKLGSIQPWRKVLGKITADNSGLNGNGIIEYYQILIEWLRKKISLNFIKSSSIKSDRTYNLTVSMEEIKIGAQL